MAFSMDSRRPVARAYDEAEVREVIATMPDLTLAEVAAVVGKPACPGTVCRT